MGTVNRDVLPSLLPTATSSPPIAAVLPTLTPLPPSHTPTPEVDEAEDGPPPEGPPTETPRPTRPPRPTRTPRPTETPTITPTPSVTLTPSVTPRPTPSAEPHYWFDRPIGPDGTDFVAGFYPYASTGEGQYAVHHGVEFVNEPLTPVLAVAPGTVLMARTDDNTLLGPPDWDAGENGPFYGNVVVIEHDTRYRGQPVYTLYGHLDSFSVREGQRVNSGDTIGRVGDSGVALGPHLHFEVRVGKNEYGATRNPQLWLKPFEGNGTLVGKVLDAEGNPVPEAYLSLQEAGSDRLYQFGYSYAEGAINADDEWGENFLFGDVPAGRWTVAADIHGEIVVKEISVREGETSWVWLEARGESTGEAE